MKLTPLVLLILGTISLVSAQNLLNFSVGPTWPKETLSSETESSAMWNSSVAWGKVFDKRIIIGAKADFGWKVVRFSGDYVRIDSTPTGSDMVYDTVYTNSDNIYRKQRSFMVPLSVWIGIDPVPQYRFHPVITAQVGYNSLFYSESNYDSGSDDISTEGTFKYYNGFLAKMGLDGMFDLGKSASVFAGVQYQIAPLYHKDGNKLKQMSMNGLGLRFGVSFLY